MLKLIHFLKLKTFLNFSNKKCFLNNAHTHTHTHVNKYKYIFSLEYVYSRNFSLNLRNLSDSSSFFEYSSKQNRRAISFNPKNFLNILFFKCTPSHLTWKKNLPNAAAFSLLNALNIYTTPTLSYNKIELSFKIFPSTPSFLKTN